MVTDLLILYSPMLRIVIVAVPNDLLPVPEQIICVLCLMEFRESHGLRIRG